MELVLVIMAILALAIVAEPLMRRLLAALAHLEGKPVLPSNPIQTKQDLQSLSVVLFVLLALLVMYAWMLWGGR